MRTATCLERQMARKHQGQLTVGHLALCKGDELLEEDEETRQDPISQS